MKTTKKMEKAAAEIAHQILRIDTLEERNSDALDFHEVSVWELKRALLRAYEMGHKAGSNMDDNRG